MSSVIYAPVNAVNQYRGIITTLPDDLVLTPEQTNELCNLEQDFVRLGESIFSSAKIITLFNSTQNLGLIYFAIEKGFCLLEIAKNYNLTPEIAFLLSKRVDKTPDYNNALTPFLLINPAIYQNAPLFRAVWNNVFATALKAKLLSIMGLGAYLIENIDSFSADQKLLIFSSLISFSEDKRFPLKHRESFAEVSCDWMTKNESIIGSWIADNYPEYVDLPLDWLQSILGLRS